MLQLTHTNHTVKYFWSEHWHISEWKLKGKEKARYGGIGRSALTWCGRAFHQRWWIPPKERWAAPTSKGAPGPWYPSLNLITWVKKQLPIPSNALRTSKTPGNPIKESIVRTNHNHNKKIRRRPSKRFMILPPQSIKKDWTKAIPSTNREENRSRKQPVGGYQTHRGHQGRRRSGDPPSGRPSPSSRAPPGARWSSPASSLRFSHSLSLSLFLVFGASRFRLPRTNRSIK